MKAAQYINSATRRTIAGMLCLLPVTPSTVSAFDDEPTGWAPAYSGQPDVWQELEVELPAYPVKDNLLEVDAGTEGLQYTVYLDKASLVKSDDNVVRYTVVFISSTGVWNVNYEGLHCGERAWRRYAYGFDGQWMSLGDTPWQPVAASGFNRYQNIFYTWLMCPPGKPLTSVDDILRRMKTGADILPE